MKAGSCPSKKPGAGCMSAYKILFSEDALLDLESILDFIGADKPGAAERFGIALLTTSNFFKLFPESECQSGNVQASRMLHSPVRVYYRLDETRKLIEILHFWHAAERTPLPKCSPRVLRLKLVLDQ